MSKVHDAARNGRLVVFAGAGVSMIPPTSLPSWRDVSRMVVGALCVQAAAIAPSERVAEAEKVLGVRHLEERLPPEFQAQILASILGDGYFEVLRHLDSGQPNAAHLAVASLARRGAVRAVITTNFDSAFEAAFDRVDAPCITLDSPSHFQSFAADPGGFTSANAPCAILKIHGSAKNPSTLIDTLAQRKRGLSPAIVQALRHYLRWGPWLFLGFSGLDFEADPGYLCLAPDAAEAAGFTWFVRQGTEPRPAVVRLRELYGDRGEIVSGTLPEWLLDLADDLDPGIRPEVTAASGNVSSAPGEGLAGLERGAQAWATNLSTEVSTLALARLVEAAAEPQLAEVLYQALLASALSSGGTCRISGARVDLECLARQGLASIASILHRPTDAAREWRRVLELLPTSGAEDLRDRSRRNLACNLETLGEIEEARNFFEAALEGNRARGDAEQTAILLNDLASHWIRQADYPTAQALASEAMQLAHVAGDEEIRIVALNNLGVVAQRLEEYEKSAAIYLECEEASHRLGRDGNAAIARANRGDALALLGRLDDAESLYASALSTHERLEQRGCCAQIHNSLGHVARRRGQVEEACRQFERARDLYRSLGDPLNEASACYKLAAALTDLGRFDDAVDRTDEALVLLGERCVSLAGYIHAQRGLACLKQSRFDDAQFSYAQGYQVASDHGDAFLRATCAHNLATLHLLAQRDLEAETNYAEAADLWRKLGRPHDAAQAKLGCAAVTLDRSIAALSDAGHTDPDAHRRKAAAQSMMALYPTLIALYNDMGAAQLAAQFASSAGSTCAFLGENRAAMDAYAEAARRFHALGMRRPAAQAFERMERFANPQFTELLAHGETAPAIAVLRTLSGLAAELGRDESSAIARYNMAAILSRSAEGRAEARDLALGVLKDVPADSEIARAATTLMAICDQHDSGQ